MAKIIGLCALTIIIFSSSLCVAEINSTSDQLKLALDLVTKVNSCRQITPQNERECINVDRNLVDRACSLISEYGTEADIEKMLQILDYDYYHGFDFDRDVFSTSMAPDDFCVIRALEKSKTMQFNTILRWIKKGGFPNVQALLDLIHKKWGWSILDEWEAQIELETDPQVAERLFRCKIGFLEAFADSLYNSDPDECEFALKKYLEDPHGAQSRYRINEDKILSILSGLKNKWKETQIDLLSDFFSLTRFKDDEKNPTKRSGYPQESILYLNYPAVEAMVKIPGLEMNDVFGWIEEGKKPELMAGLLYARWGKDALTGLDAAIKSETDSAKRKSLDECKRLILENPNGSIYEPKTALPETPNP